MSEDLKSGDYVLATKWSDGDPQDHWFVGVYEYCDERGRHYILDSDGRNVRGNGFRRAQKITPERGEWILSQIEKIQNSNRSLWYWARASMSKAGVIR